MSDGHFHTGAYRGEVALCKASFDFHGNDPTLWCDLPRGHGGDWHVEQGVGRWTLDGETFQWWQWDGPDFLFGKGHWESDEPTEPYPGWHMATWDGGSKMTTCTCDLTHDHSIDEPSELEPKGARLSGSVSPQIKSVGTATPATGV